MFNQYIFLYYLGRFPPCRKQASPQPSQSHLSRKTHHAFPPTTSKLLNHFIFGNKKTPVHHSPLLQAPRIPKSPTFGVFIPLKPLVNPVPIACVACLSAEPFTEHEKTHRKPLFFQLNSLFNCLSQPSR